MAAVKRLSAEKLRVALGDDVLIGREIIVRDTTASTNNDVWQLACGGAPEGVVVFAEHQTAGRGQHGNTWESATGLGLWFSFLLRPKIDVQNSARLTEWAAKAIVWTLGSECSIATTIKLPNDIYAGDRKLAGILVEMRAQTKAHHLAIVGVGLNVFSPTLRERATSLAILKRGPVDRHQLAVGLLRNFNAMPLSA